MWLNGVMTMSSKFKCKKKYHSNGVHSYSYTFNISKIKRIIITNIKTHILTLQHACV